MFRVREAAIVIEFSTYLMCISVSIAVAPYRCYRDDWEIVIVVEKERESECEILRKLAN